METLNDLVFASRNRAYGAFELRQTYATTLKQAAVLGVSLCSIGLLTSALLTWLDPRAGLPTTRTTPVNVLPPPPTEQPEKVLPPPPPPKTEAPKVSSTRFLTPEIKVEVTEEVPIATQDELQKAPAAQETVVGNPNDVEVPAEPVAKAAPEVVELKRTNDETDFLPVEQQPEFPGGLSSLAEFLRKNLRYPAEASRSGVAGKVYIEFVVRADGSIDRAQVQKGIGFGCDEEALRVVRLMPKWKPGKQSGRAVPAKFTLPIVFALE